MIADVYLLGSFQHALASECSSSVSFPFFFLLLVQLTDLGMRYIICFPGLLGTMDKGKQCGLGFLDCGTNEV